MRNLRVKGRHLTSLIKLVSVILITTIFLCLWRARIFQNQHFQCLDCSGYGNFASRELEPLAPNIMESIYPNIVDFYAVNGSYVCAYKTFIAFVPAAYPCWVADVDGWEGPQKMREMISALRAKHAAISYVVDIGGWIGDTAYAAADLDVEVYVFEPVLANYWHIRATTEINRDNLVGRRIHPYNCAISNSTSTLEIFVPENGHYDNAALGKIASTLNVGGRSATQTVTALPLDSLFKQSCPSILKIDVQGYEWSVFQGAINLLHRCSASMIILAEVDKNLIKAAVEKSPRDLVEFMENAGYILKETGGDYLFVGKSNSGWDDR